MKKGFLNALSPAVGGLTAAGIVFSYTFAAFSCLGLNIYYALSGAVICLILSAALLKDEVLAPDSFLLIPVVFTVTAAGFSYLPVSVFGGALLFVLLKPLLKKIKIPDCIIAGAALGLAFSATALFTTYYFGIGASGSYTFEILKNYRYLGFHPNWRGVFYGTITLFAMITYPFKFKKLSKYLPAEVFSVAIPFILNLFLNPDKENTPILEVGTLSDAFSLSGVKSFLPFLGIESEKGLIPSLQSGFSVALILLAYKCSGLKDTAVFTSCNALSGAVGALPSRGYSVRRYTPVSAITAVIALTAVVLLFPSLLSRVPVHSLAVVLIVSAWQNVPFSAVAASFKEKGILEIAAVIGIFASFLFFNSFWALLICIVFTVIVKAVRK